MVFMEFCTGVGIDTRTIFEAILPFRALVLVRSRSVQRCVLFVSDLFTTMPSDKAFS